MERAGGLVRLVQARGGVVTMADLRKAGFTQAEAKSAVKANLLRRLRRGLYALAGRTLSWEQKLRVATRASEPYGAVAALSAAALLRLDGFSQGRVQLIIPVKRKFEIEGVEVLRSRDFDPVADTRRVSGLCVTRVPRTLLDLVEYCSEPQLIIGIEGLLRDHRGLLLGAVDYLRERARGRRKVLRVVELILARKHSVATDDEWEVRAEFVLHRANLYPSRQVVIRRPNGTFVARPDFVFRDHKLVIEVDGEQTHGTPRGKVRDRERTAALKDLGYEVFVTKPHEVHTDPDGFIARLRAILATRPVVPVSPIAPEPEQLDLVLP